MTITPIATIHTEFPEKFGVPRQSGLAASLRGRIVFEPDFRNPDALRGLEEFSHIWLIWEFSANVRRNAVSEVSAAHDWQPTVRPPRLGGNKAMGVFATRSPFRPNPLGLSCVEVESVEFTTDQGPVINVRGADLTDGTPIYDIKPYIRYADSRPDALCGYVDGLSERRLNVDIPEKQAMKMGESLEALTDVLSLDPRPSYQNDPHREYGMSFAGRNIRFLVMGETLTVLDIE